MTQLGLRAFSLGPVLTLVLASLLPVPALAGGSSRDPAKVVGPERCAECHEAEAAAWKRTHHFQTFLDMHRKEEAKAIIDKLGGSRIKVNPHCVSCHYTQGLKNDKPRSMWGVTCESCHGAGADWVDVHNAYGPKGTTRETETPAHKKQRITAAVTAGMIRPSETYTVAANCFSCHTIPDEELVNVGGHKQRSAFELVAWSQGEIRHNYADAGANRPADAAHKRILYVTGRALDLEYSLRAAAKATGSGPFLEAAQGGVAGAIEHLKAIQAAQALPEVAAMLETASRVAVEPGARAALDKAAAAVGAAAERFVANHDGSALTALDSLLPSESEYKGAAQP
jgi:hypothetical protein